MRQPAGAVLMSPCLHADGWWVVGRAALGGGCWRASACVHLLCLLLRRDSFFACDRSPASRGYSGVATFVRSSLALPHAAEEGFSGLCAPAGGGGGGAAGGSAQRVHPALAERFSVEELQVGVACARKRGFSCPVWPFLLWWRQCWTKYALPRSEEECGSGAKN